MYPADGNNGHESEKKRNSAEKTDIKYTRVTLVHFHIFKM